MEKTAHNEIAERQHVLLATLGQGDLGALAAVLASQGAEVSVLAQRVRDHAGRQAQIASVPRVREFSWDASSRETTHDSIDALLQESSPPSQVIIHALPTAALTGTQLIEHEDAAWHAACGAASLQVMQLLQALAPQLIARRSSVAFIGASLALVGAARLAALVTLHESLRGLMKSLSRQWGPHGVTCNWVALEACELWDGFAGFRRPARLEAIPVALGRRPDAASDLAGVLAFLASPAGRSVTGATVCLDGGEWMTP